MSFEFASLAVELFIVRRTRNPFGGTTMRSGIERSFRARMDDYRAPLGYQRLTTDDRRTPADRAEVDLRLDFFDAGIAGHDVGKNDIDLTLSPRCRRSWLKFGLAMTFVVVTALGGLGIVAQSRFRQRAVLRQAAGAVFKENGSSSTWSARNFWSLLAGEPTYIIYLPGDNFSAEDMFAYGKAFPESVVIRQRAMNDATMDHWVDRAVIPFSPSPAAE